MGNFTTPLLPRLSFTLSFPAPSSKQCREKGIGTYSLIGLSVAFFSSLFHPLPPWDLQTTPVPSGNIHKLLCGVPHGFQCGHIAQGWFSPQTAGETPAPASRVSPSFPHFLAFMLPRLFLSCALWWVCDGASWKQLCSAQGSPSLSSQRPSLQPLLWRQGTCTQCSSMHQTKHIPTISGFYFLNLSTFIPLQEIMLTLLSIQKEEQLNFYDFHDSQALIWNK